MYTLREDRKPIAVAASAAEAVGSFTAVLDYAAEKLQATIAELTIEKRSGSVLFYHEDTDPATVQPRLSNPSPGTNAPMIGHPKC